MTFDSVIPKIAGSKSKGLFYLKGIWGCFRLRGGTSYRVLYIALVRFEVISVNERGAEVADFDMEFVEKNRAFCVDI